MTSYTQRRSCASDYVMKWDYNAFVFYSDTSGMNSDVGGTVTGG